MLERIRTRLTFGYVGIFALILVFVGAVVVVSFWRQAAAQQDKLLAQKAQGTSDWVRGPALGRYVEGREPGPRKPPDDDDDGPIGPIENSTEPDLGVLALVLAEGATGESEVLSSSPSSSSFGLPFEEPARRRAAEEGQTLTETLEGPGGEMLRVVSVPMSGHGEVAVVQAAQSRQVVWEAVGRLPLILVPVGVGGLLLAGVGGLYMSGWAMEPVSDSFRRQRTFIADASHELQTPLALAKINAEVIKRDPTDPGNEEILEEQLSELDRMDALLYDLLVLARLDAHKLEVESKPFDLSVVAAETAGRFLARAAKEGVVLEVEAPEELPVMGDPARTAQILAALLDNAMRYTPEGGTATVSSGPTLDARAEARVTDTGPGIAAEHLMSIFERFHRAEEARTRKGGGTGLGLSIAREVARAQGASLRPRTPKAGERYFV